MEKNDLQEVRNAAWFGSFFLALRLNANVAAHVWCIYVLLLSMCGPLIKIWVYMWQRLAGSAQQLHVAFSLTLRVLIMDD